jgi:hypothetical protein
MSQLSENYSSIVELQLTVTRVVDDRRSDPAKLIMDGAEFGGPCALTRLSGSLHA